MSIFQKLKARPFLTGVLMLLVVLVLLVVASSSKTALHDRTWRAELAVLPEVSLGPKLFRIKSIRDWTYTGEAPATQDYRAAAFLYSDLKQIWFVLEPFENSDDIAHTFLLFEFSDGQLLGVTVEARKEEGETYSAWDGLWNNYELIYVWGTAKDLLTRRALYLDHDVYLYPLTLTPDQEKTVLTQLLSTTKDIEKLPRFYNTLFNNCTSELADSVGLPWDLAQIFTGWSPDYLEKNGLIKTQAEALQKDLILELKDLPTGAFSQAFLARLTGTEVPELSEE